MVPRGEEDPKKILTERFDNGVHKADVITSVKPHFDKLSREIDGLRRELYNTRDANKVEKSRIQAKLDQLRAEAETCREKPAVVTIRDDFDELTRLGDEAQLEVVVPSEMFAKEPRAWVSWLASRYTFWNGAPHDECDVERRAAFTVITSPLALIVLAMLGICLTLIAVVNVATMGALLLGGFRGMAFELLNPLESHPGKIVDAMEPSFWTHRRSETSGKESPFRSERFEGRAAILFVLNPTTIVLAVLIGGGIGLLSGAAQSGVLIALGALVVVAIIVAAIASGPAKNWRAEQKALRLKAEEEAHKREQEELSKELEMMTCGTQSSEVSVRALPKERRTVVLRVQAFKAKHCKPFAKA